MSGEPQQIAPVQATPQLAAAMVAPPRERRLVRLARFMRPANLLWAIPGPLFQKEVWLQGRRRGTYWTRGLYALGLLGLVTLVFVTALEEPRYGNVLSNAARLQSLQGVAPAVTAALVWFQFVALSLAAGIMAGPSISDERRAGSLGTLLTTPLAAWQIVLGKLAGIMTQLLILLLVSTPLLLAVRVFGGVTADVIVASACVSMSTALLVAMAGVSSSITSPRANQSMVAGLATGVLLVFVVPLAMIAVQVGVPGVRFSEYFYAMFSTPIAQGLLTAKIFTNEVDQYAWVWIVAVVYNVALSAALFAYASWSLRRVMVRDAGGVPTLAPRRAAKKRAGIPPPPLPAIGQAPAEVQRPALAQTPAQATETLAAEPTRVVPERNSREVGDTPVLWRELRQRMFRNRVQAIVMGVVVAGAMCFTYYHVKPSEQDMMYPVVVLTLMIMLASAAVGAAGAITGERESRSLDVLMTTRLTGFEIIFGKVMGALRRMVYLPAALAVHLLLALLWGAPVMGLPILLAVVMIPPVFFICASGALMSVLARKTVTAATMNLGVAMAMWVVMPIIAGLLFDAYGQQDYRMVVSTTIFTLNPVALAVQVVETNFSPSRHTLFEMGDVGPGMFYAAVFSAGAFYGLLGYAAMRLAAWILAKRYARGA